MSKISHSELLTKREENYQKAIELEKIEKEKYQRKIEEMEKKLSGLAPNASSSIQVNLIILNKKFSRSFLKIILC
jgi:uncharacterized protein YcsI (UPF0317 family)